MTVVHPYELDIVLLDKKIAFEFNGTYYHSEELIFEKHGISSLEYHTRKKELAEKIGIKLFHIWETDWNTRAEEIKKAIRESILEGKSRKILGKMTA